LLFSTGNKIEKQEKDCRDGKKEPKGVEKNYAKSGGALEEDMTAQ
jgi:hypothetical protein